MHRITPPVLGVMSRGLLACALVFSCTACETIDKARMKLFGITVTNPESETAEWVLREALYAAADKDEEKGWERLQKVLHSDQRTTNALRGWHEHNWPRMRKQAHLYLDDQGTFILRDFKVQQNGGVDYFVENRHRDMPTPCAVYIDPANNGLWRIKRCSF